MTLDQRDCGEANDWIGLTHEALPSLEDIIAFVQRDDAGAIATFLGTTRNHFQGKRVSTLYYEAYEPLALKSLREIVQRARNEWPSLARVAVLHRLGEVPVGRISVVVAVSSEHRHEAMEAVRFLIDTLKRETAVWKKEVYADGQAAWKENCPGCHANKSRLPNVAHFPLLATLHQAQQQHGLRHGDYQRYRHFCTRRVHRFRGQLQFHHTPDDLHVPTTTTTTGGKKRKQPTTVFQKRSLTMPELQGDAADAETLRAHLSMVLFEAERAWSYAMESKAAAASTQPSRKHHARQKLRRAAQFAAQLELVSRADAETPEMLQWDARSVLEIQAYGAWMQGLYAFEAQQWKQALDQFAIARTVYAKLAETGDAQEEALCHARLDEIDPSIRYCAYNLQHQGQDIGVASAVDIEQIVQLRTAARREDASSSALADMLEAKMEALLLHARESRIGTMTQVEWRGQVLPVKHAKLSVALLKIQELESSAPETSSSASSTQDTLSRFDRILEAYADAETIAEAAVKADADASAKVVTSRSEETSNIMKLLASYVSYGRLMQNMTRSLVMIRRMVGGKGLSLLPAVAAGGGRALKKPMDAARLAEELLQCVTEMKELHGLRSDPMFQYEAGALTYLFQAFKCVYLGLQHAHEGRNVESAELYRRASAYHRQATRELPLADPSSPLLQMLNVSSMMEEIPAFLQKETVCAAAAAVLGSSAGVPLSADLEKAYAVEWMPMVPGQVADVPYVTYIPPSVQPIPGKPIFFDLAYHQIVDDFPVEELLTSGSDGGKSTTSAEGTSGTGLVQGLLGSWWNRS